MCYNACISSDISSPLQESLVLGQVRKRVSGWGAAQANVLLVQVPDQPKHGADVRIVTPHTEDCEALQGPKRNASAGAPAPPKLEPGLSAASPTMHDEADCQSAQELTVGCR